MYSARIPKLAISCQNFKIALNVYFSKFQKMIIYISYELFWHMASKLQKKQVKLDKMGIFVYKMTSHCTKSLKYLSKMSFFQKLNSNAKITHMSVASIEISSYRRQLLYIFEW